MFFRFENNKYSKRGKTNGLLLYGVTLLFETKKKGSFGVMSRQSKPVPKEGFSPSFETDFYGFLYHIETLSVYEK